MQAKTGAEVLSRLDRNIDGKISRSEFQVIVNWLFQLASSSEGLMLEDTQKEAPPSAPRPKTKDPADTTGRTAPAWMKPSLIVKGVLQPSCSRVERA